MAPFSSRRRLLTASALVSALMLGGCANWNMLQSEVSTYGEWPSGRKAGTYVFERLPSQKSRADSASALEAAASGALTRAGFTAVTDPQTAEFVVQVGARITRTDLTHWDDPLWWRWNRRWWGYASHPGAVRPAGPWWVPPPYSMRDIPRYDREVALLIRERRSGDPLFEARASSDGASAGSNEVLRAMFDAALSDFPRIEPKPRMVSTPLTAPATAP